MPVRPFHHRRDAKAARAKGDWGVHGSEMAQNAPACKVAFVSRPDHMQAFLNSEKYCE